MAKKALNSSFMTAYCLESGVPGDTTTLPGANPPCEGAREWIGGSMQINCSYNPTASPPASSPSDPP